MVCNFLVELTSVQINLYLPNALQGKLIELHFNPSGRICGAKIETCKLSPGTN